MSLKSNENQEGEEENSLFLYSIIDIFVFSILCVFPLIVHDKYFDILPTKYYFFIGSVAIMVFLLILCILINYKKVQHYFQNITWDGFMKSFSTTDIALLLFLLVAIISTLASDYVYEAFWGNEGRLSGLFLLGLYGIAYFCVTRFGSMKKWYLDAFLVVSLWVCVFGITDYFQLDIMNFKQGMHEDQMPIFTSTIGNINTYTSLVGMVAAVSTVLFVAENKQTYKYFYYTCMVISFFAIIMGESDNAYLSLAALFGLLPLYLFGTIKGVKSYSLVIATFLTVIQCIDWINVAMSDQVLGINSAFNIIVDYSRLLYIVVIFWMIVILLYGYSYFKKIKDDISCNRLRVFWLVFLCVGIFAVGFAWFDVNVNDNVARYGSLGSYLLFNDEWGSNRGYIWRNSMECFKEFSPMRKFFGYGPDTFGILLLDKTSGNIYHTIYDNAHNEYIHYLLTVGIAGVVAYLVFIGSFVIRTIRYSSHIPYAMAAMFGVVCYGVQAFVNLNLPIATPIMWVLLMIGAGVCRNIKKNNQ